MSGLDHAAVGLLTKEDPFFLLPKVMKCLSLEYAEDEILVSSIHPGWVQTDMGGNQAPLTKEESVRHMIATIAKMETGKFYNFDFAESGKYLPW